MIAEKEPDVGIRTPGRRKDRGPSLISVLSVAVVLAWAWGVYELTLLFLK